MLHSLRSTVAAMGLLNTLLYGVNRAVARVGLAPVVRRYVLVAQPVASRPALAPGRGKATSVREVGAGDVALASLPLPAKVIHDRFAQGAVCLGLFKDAQIVACTWLCTTAYDEDEVRCRFVPLPAGAAAWDFDVYIKPEWRAGRIFARLWDATNRRLSEGGYAWSMSRISAFNPLSLASHRRLGARQLGTATFLRLGSLQLMVASIAPYVHFSWRDASAPRLELRAPAPPAD